MVRSPTIVSVWEILGWDMFPIQVESTNFIHTPFIRQQIHVVVAMSSIREWLRTVDWLYGQGKYGERIGWWRRLFNSGNVCKVVRYVCVCRLCNKPNTHWSANKDVCLNDIYRQPASTEWCYSFHHVNFWPPQFGRVDIHRSIGDSFNNACIFDYK